MALFTALETGSVDDCRVSTSPPMLRASASCRGVGALSKGRGMVAGILRPSYQLPKLRTWVQFSSPGPKNLLILRDLLSACQGCP